MTRPTQKLLPSADLEMPSGAPGSSSIKISLVPACSNSPRLGDLKQILS